MATKYDAFTTPVGEAFYPRLKTPEVYNGEEIGYSIQVKFDENTNQSLIARNLEILAAAKNSDDFKGKKWGTDPYLGYKEQDDGSKLFKFKTKHFYTDKDGNEVPKVIKVYDTQNNLMDVNLGNGSMVRINYTPVPYHSSAKNFGVTMYLNAVQVIKLVEYLGGASPFDSYDSTDPFAQEEIPF